MNKNTSVGVCGVQHHIPMNLGGLLSTCTLGNRPQTLLWATGLTEASKPSPASQLCGGKPGHCGPGKTPTKRDFIEAQPPQGEIPALHWRKQK